MEKIGEPENATDKKDHVEDVKTAKEDDRSKVVAKEADKEVRDSNEVKDKRVVKEEVKAVKFTPLTAEETAPVLLVLIIPVLLVSSALFYFTVLYRSQPPDNNFNLAREEVAVPQEAQQPTNIPRSSTKEPKTPIVKRQQSLPGYPNCTIHEYLEETLQDVVEKLQWQRQCKVGNFSEETQQEPRGDFVIYIAVGLLLTSLAAALVDVYKVKKPSKSKPPLTKRCSLADLTVLRHSRRESMRKESIADEQRGPLKLLDPIP